MSKKRQTSVQHWYPKDERDARQAAENEARAQRATANLAIDYKRATKLMERPRRRYWATHTEAEALKKHTKLQAKVKQLEERMYNDDQG